jgi:hypothetical protein
MPSARNRAAHNSSLAQKHRRGSRSASARCPIATTGEAFANGTIIELLQDAANPQRLSLILRRDDRTTTGRVIEHNGQLYQPAPLDATILRAITLPTGIAPYGSARELIHGIAQEISRYTALPERFVSQVSWSFLSTWFVDVTETAPSLCILGSDTIAGNQLFRLSAALCRRPLLLSAARFSGVCSLPTGLQPTLLIREARFDRDMLRLLSAAHKLGEYVPRGGGLVELHSPVITLSEFGAEDLPARIILKIPVIEGQSPALRLGSESFEKIKNFFQPLLLAFRLENRGKVLHSQFDAPLLADPVREVARCLGACTPDDAELQAELLKLLQSTNAEYLSAKSADFRIVVVECLLYCSHERPGGEVFVGEVAEKVQTILVSGGDLIAVTPRRVGKIIDNLGLQTEPRNKRGYRVLLTQAVCRRIHELARQFGLLPFADGVERCKLCRSDARADGV